MRRDGGALEDWGVYLDPTVLNNGLVLGALFYPGPCVAGYSSSSSSGHNSSKG